MSFLYPDPVIPEAMSEISTNPEVNNEGQKYLSRVFGLPIVVLGGTEMLTVLDGTVVALAIPKISEQYNISPSSTSWFVTAYVLSFAGFLLLGGRLGDALGRKKVFVCGIAILVTASLLTGFSEFFSTFIICRIVQGFGAALAAPNALAYVATLYTPGKMRSQAVGIYGAMMGLGSVLGLTLGGLLANFDWRWVFWINVPVGITLIIGALKSIPETLTEKVHIDYFGVFSLTLGSAGIITAISLIGKVVFPSPYFYVPLILGIVFVALFIFNEKKTTDPVIPLHLLMHKNRVLALIATFFAGAIMTCMALYTAQYLQIIIKFTPQQSGLAVLPFAIGMGIAMVISQFISQRIAPRWIIIAAGTLLLACFVYVKKMLEDYPGYFPQLFFVIGVIGFGVGLVLTSILLAVLAGVAPQETGVLSAVQKVILEIGGGTGVVVIGTLQNLKIIGAGGIVHSLGNLTPVEEGRLISGYSFSILCVGFVAVITGIVVAFMNFTPEEVLIGIKSKEKAESGIID